MGEEVGGGFSRDPQRYSFSGNNASRSFDRTFLIAPAAPGSRSANAGSPYTILNDQVVLRSHSSRPGWIAEPEQSSHGRQTSSSSTSSAAVIASGIGNIPPQLGDAAALMQMKFVFGLVRAAY